MERPSKKDIKAALDRMRSGEGPSDMAQKPQPTLQAKKPNKNRIRKQGV